MLSSIKDKFLTVTNYVPLFNANKEKDFGQVENGNLNAGCSILSHYQNHWQNLHATNENNATKASEVANAISTITSKIDKDRESFATMTNILTNSNLIVTIKNCTKQMKQLHTSCTQVEEALLDLESIIDNIAFEKMKKQHRFHLKEYKVRKEESLRDLEVSLKLDYEKSLKENELKKKKQLEERQLVFQEAFKTDLEIFKSSGTIPKLDLPRKQPSALLEEIQVDYDEGELDQFFAEDPSN